MRYRGTTGETLKVACKPCYDRFRAKQAGKDVCQFCWRCIEREERHLKIRYKVEKYFIFTIFSMFWWNWFGFYSKSDTGTVWPRKQTSVKWQKNRFLSELISITLLSIFLYTICWIEGFEIFNMFEIYLNNFIREIRTTAIISIATHAATSWLEIVKNTLGNFYAGGVMINPRYQYVVHAGDRSKDVLSVQWTRWVSPKPPNLKKYFSRGMWSILYVIIARNRFWMILILSALMMENHIANIITTNFLAILAHGADALFSLR